MELKEGYKKTDVGIIPNEWTPKAYGELFHFLTTSSYSRDELSEEGDVRCVHYGDIHTKYHQFIDFQNDFKSFIDAENGKKYPFIKDGDIIMADASEDYSGIGKSVEVKNLADKPAISGLHTFLLRDKNSDFVDGFRAYIHSMIPVKKSFDRLATGLKVYGVSKGNLKTVLVPVPPKPEQQAIAIALSDVDTLIAKLDKLIAKKKAIKQGAMQRLLKSPAQGGQRLPGFEGEWEGKIIDELCTTFTKQTGFDYSSNIKPTLTNDYKPGTLPFIQNKDFDGHWVNYNPDYFIPEHVAERFPRILLNERCLLISISGSIGKVGVFNNKTKAFIGGAVAVGKFRNPEYLDWVMYYLQSEKGQALMLKDVKAGSHQNLILDDIRKMQIPIPSIAEQKGISLILFDMDKEIESLEAKKSKYLLIKQGMMQELLTGKTRLV